MPRDIEWGRTPDFLSAQLRAAQIKIYEHFTDWFSDTGLTSTQFGVLYIISLNPEVNQRNLAQVHASERAAFGETVKRLEQKGFVDRVQSASDKRAKLATVTPAGRKALDKVLDNIAKQERSCVAALSDSERHQLLALLLKVNRSVAGPVEDG